MVILLYFESNLLLLMKLQCICVWCMCVYIYIYMYIYICMYVYIEREFIIYSGFFQNSFFLDPNIFFVVLSYCICEI